MSLTPKCPQISVSLDQISERLTDGRLALIEALRKKGLNDGLSCYMVGGPVRDFLLGVPIRDLDIAVEGDAMALAAELAQELGGKLTTHRRFGTATVELAGNHLDLVTARREVYSRPGALPKVSPASIIDDLERRDFSMNAVAFPIYSDRTAWPTLNMASCGPSTGAALWTTRPGCSEPCGTSSGWASVWRNLL